MSKTKNLILCFFLLASACQQEEASRSHERPTSGGDILAGGFNSGIGTSPTTSVFMFSPPPPNAARGLTETNAKQEPDSILVASPGSDTPLTFNLTEAQLQTTFFNADVKAALGSGSTAKFVNAYAHCAVAGSTLNSAKLGVGDAARRAFSNYMDAAQASSDLLDAKFSSLYVLAPNSERLALIDIAGEKKVAVEKTLADANTAEFKFATCTRNTNGSWVATNVERLTLTQGNDQSWMTSTIYSVAGDSFSKVSWAPTPYDDTTFLAPEHPFTAVSFLQTEMEGAFFISASYLPGESQLKASTAYVTSVSTKVGPETTKSAYVNVADANFKLTEDTAGLLSHSLLALSTQQARGSSNVCHSQSANFKSHFDFTSPDTMTIQSSQRPSACASHSAFAQNADLREAYLAEIKNALSAASQLCNSSAPERSTSLFILALANPTPLSCNAASLTPFLGALVKEDPNSSQNTAY
jgi:hypothetical protein